MTDGKPIRLATLVASATGDRPVLRIDTAGKISAARQIRKPLNGDKARTNPDIAAFEQARARRLENDF